MGEEAHPNRADRPIRCPIGTVDTSLDSKTPAHNGWTYKGVNPIMKTQIEFLMAYIPARLDVTSERGASLVEYALLVALIAVVCIAAVTALGEAASENFTEVANEIGS